MPYRTQAQDRRGRTRVLAAAAVLAASTVGGCESSTGPSVTLPAGFMQVEYTGSVEGVLSVTGELRLDEGRVVRQAFAAAGANQYTPEDKLTVVAYQPTGAREGIYFAITVPDLPEGSAVSIDANCFDLQCSSTLMFFGVGPHRPHEDVDPEVDRACWIDTGTLLITERTGTRVAGTFAGAGSCVFDIRTDPLTAFVVQEASFDVPISFLYQPRIDLR